MRTRAKRFLLTILSFLTVLIAISPQHYIANADNGKSQITNGLKEYNDGETPEVMAQLREEGEPQNKDSIQYILFRVLKPGYINNVEKGNYASEDFIDKTVRDDATGSVCLPNEPQNLANHNCDVPNIMGEFAQSFFNIIGTQGIQNGERTTARSNFGFGVPSGIPGDNVPVKTKGAPIEYSGLEKYGYELEFTTYAGEWDRISVSTQARLLSNFGLYDSILLTGTSIFNGLKSGITNLVNNFTWNPFMWIPSFTNGAVSGSLNTIIDTSDLNVIASHSWTRPSFPVYNVAYISNKDVTLNAQLLYMNQFPGMLKEEAEKDPEVKKLIELQNLPKFEYDPARETDDSKKAREEVIAYNETVGDGDKKEVPAPIYMSKEDQFKDFKNSDFFKSAKGELRKCANSDSYEEMSKCWPQAWQSMGEQVLEGRSALVKKLSEKVKNKFFKENPIANPNVTISHYVCADENNNPLGSIGSYQFYFKGFNSPDSENINNCGTGTARQPIKGGYFGTGDDKMTDTRRLAFSSGNILSDFLNPLDNIPNEIATFLQSISVFATKLTNMLVGFAFDDLIEKLGLLDLLDTVITTLMNSLFFPFVVLGSAITGVYYLMKLIRHKSLIDSFKGVLIFLLIFFIGMFAVTNAKSIVKSVEVIPNTIDKIVLEATQSAKNVDNSVCSISGTNSGIRNVQCTIWEFNVFQPWVQGQFGTSYENLNTDNMKNTNSHIVGDASVDMGGGKIVRNWATYQLEKTKSGSITTSDNSANDGTTDANLYRLVDLQAGPNNGEGTDSRFFETWSNGEYNRIMSMLYSTFTSIASLIVLGGLAIVKIEIKLLLILYIFMLPFALIVGLFANKYLKTVKYANTILMLFVKQLALSLIFSILMITISGITKVASNVSFSTISILFIAILMFGYMYRKEFVNMLSVTSHSTFSSESSIVKDTASKMIPRNVRFKYENIKANIKGTIGGAIGGAVREMEYRNSTATSILTEALQGAVNETRRNERMTFNKHRKYGFNVLTKMENAKDIVLEKKQNDVLANPLGKAMLRELRYKASTSKNTDYHYIANLTDRELLTKDIIQFITLKRQSVTNGEIQDPNQLIGDNAEEWLKIIAKANPQRRVMKHIEAQSIDKENLNKYKHIYTRQDDTYYDDAFKNVDIDSEEQKEFVKRQRAIEERLHENDYNNNTSNDFKDEDNNNTFDDFKDEDNNNTFDDSKDENNNNPFDDFRDEDNNNLFNDFRDDDNNNLSDNFKDEDNNNIFDDFRDDDNNNPSDNFKDEDNNNTFDEYDVKSFNENKKEHIIGEINTYEQNKTVNNDNQEQQVNKTINREENKNNVSINRKPIRRKSVVQELFDTEEKHEEVIINAVKETVDNVKQKIVNVLEGEKTEKVKNILTEMFETKDEVDLSKNKNIKQNRKISRKKSLKNELENDDFWDNIN